MESPLHKSVTGSSAHLEQSGVQKSMGEDCSRLRQRRIPQSRNLLSWDRTTDISQQCISPRKNEIAESRASLASQELKSSRPRNHESLEVSTDLDRQMIPVGTAG